MFGWLSLLFYCVASSILLFFCLSLLSLSLFFLCWPLLFVFLFSLIDDYMFW